LLSGRAERQRRRETDLALAGLSRMLLGPVWHALAAGRLAVVADGAVHYVPFAAFPLDGEPLIRGREVVHLPSASTLALLRPDFHSHTGTVSGCHSRTWSLV
jgi:CHAT domain